MKTGLEVTRVQQLRRQMEFHKKEALWCQVQIDTVQSQCKHEWERDRSTDTCRCSKCELTASRLFPSSAA
jgi:hypothetical protein